MKCVALTYGADSQSRPIEMAPDSAVVYRGNPWFVPDTDRRWQASFWLAAVIDRLGKNISARFARRYYNNVCLAAHPASDADAEQWLRDGAVVKGPDIALASLPAEFSARLERAGAEPEVFGPFDTADLLARLDDAVVTASALATVKTGDLLLIPFPIPDVPLCERTDFQVYISQTQALKFKTR